MKLRVTTKRMPKTSPRTAIHDGDAPCNQGAGTLLLFSWFDLLGHLTQHFLFCPLTFYEDIMRRVIGRRIHEWPIHRRCERTKRSASVWRCPRGLALRFLSYSWRF
jgi:hypothetical protein